MSSQTIPAPFPSAERGVGGLSEDQIEAARAAVFERSEFAPREPTPFERLFDWFLGLFEQLGFSGEPPEGLAMAVLWALLVILAGFLFLAMRRVARELPQSRQRELAEEVSIRERVSELRGQAERARASGDQLLALRLYFFALVVGLGRKGDLEYRDAWTNRELLARGRPSAPVARELEPLVAELDHKLFGDGQTSEADLDRLAAMCDRWLGEPAR